MQSRRIAGGRHHPELSWHSRMLDHRWILLLAAAGLIPLTVHAGPAVPGAPVVISCDGQSERRPASLQIGCATGSVMVSNIHWSRWDRNGARGRGTLVVNSCIYKGGPTCVEGQTMSYPASLSLGRPASGPGITALTELKLVFSDGGPAGLWSGTYRLNNTRRE